MVLGLVLLIGFGQSVVKALMMGVVGMVLGHVGTDPSGHAALHLRVAELLDGMASCR